MAQLSLVIWVLDIYLSSVLQTLYPQSFSLSHFSGLRHPVSVSILPQTETRCRHFLIREGRGGLAALGQ